jgi:sulfatase modifying factor 1
MARNQAFSVFKPAFDRLRNPVLKALERRLPDKNRWDRLPTALLLTAGAVAGFALAWLALRHPAATLALALLVVLLAGWQGRRIRVVLEGDDIPAEIDEPAPAHLAPPLTAPEVSPHPTPVVAQPQLVQDLLLELIELPGGHFWMGADNETDPQADDNEAPRRRIRLSPFAIARVPVTRGLYRKVMGRGPSEWNDADDDRLPADLISWEDAARFCNALSERSERRPCYRESKQGWTCDWSAEGYRLPTEAEWEYACRAGTDTPWFWDPDEIGAEAHAWYAANSGDKVHPVGTKAANPWGLHDMAGNVWERCWDWYADNYDSEDIHDPRGPATGRWRVLRGGSFLNVPRNLRSANRPLCQHRCRLFLKTFV